MAHVWMDEGTVVIPFVNIEAAYTAFRLHRNRDSVLGIHLAHRTDDDVILVHETQEGKTFTVITGGNQELITVKPAYLIVPAVGPITEYYYKLTRMAKIRLAAPKVVFHCLQHNATLQSLEQPMAPPNWPLYRPGSFNK